MTLNVSNCNFYRILADRDAKSGNKLLSILYFSGIGASLMYISMTIIINERFVKRIGKANGVSLAGKGGLLV